MYMCRNVRKWLCPILAVLIAGFSIPGSAKSPMEYAPGIESDASAVDTTVISLWSEILQLRAEQDRLEASMQALEDPVADVCLQKQMMDQRLALLAKELSCFDRMLAYYDQVLAEEEIFYQELQTEYRREFQIFAGRLRQNYEEGLPGLLEQFSRSDSLLSLMVGVERNQQIQEFDRVLMESLESKLQSLSDSIAKQETLRLERNEASIQQVARLQLFYVGLQECGTYLQSLQGDLNRFSYFLQQSQAGEQTVDRTILSALSALEAELARQGEDRYLAVKAEKEALYGESIRSAMERGSLQKGTAFFADGVAYILPLKQTDEQAIAILSPVGYRTYQASGKVFTEYHAGLDLSAEYGAEAVASASGIVVATGYENGYGYYVAIRHADGTHTRYAHLRSVSVEAGDYVLQGETIGAAGSSGNIAGVGIHFELWIGGVRVNPQAHLNFGADSAAKAAEQVAE